MASDERSQEPQLPGGVDGLNRFSGVRIGDEVVDAALRLVVSLAQSAVGGADGVSVSLRRRGALATVAATDQTISDMDAQQYATGEGPCVSASVEGHRFYAQSLESETRWPAFTPRAHALGINSVLSAPLLVDERPVGALNIYSLATAAFRRQDEELASQFAAEASAILSSADRDMTDAQLSSRLQTALRAREVIALAQGILMERHRVGEAAAFDLLRRSSQESGRPLHLGAEDIVSSNLARPGQGEPRD